MLREADGACTGLPIHPPLVMVNSLGAMLAIGVSVAGWPIRSSSSVILSAPSTRPLSCISITSYPSFLCARRKPRLNMQEHGCIQIWMINVKVAPSAPSKLHVKYGLLVGDRAKQRSGGVLSVHGEEFYGSNRKITCSIIIG